MNFPEYQIIKKSKQHQSEINNIKTIHKYDSPQRL